jgi:hypothetical protein
LPDHWIWESREATIDVIHTSETDGVGNRFILCAEVARIAGEDQVGVDSVAELNGEVLDIFEETSLR